MPLRDLASCGHFQAEAQRLDVELHDRIATRSRGGGTRLHVAFARRHDRGGRRDRGAVFGQREVGRAHWGKWACRALITRSEVGAIHHRRGGYKLRRLLWVLDELGGAEECVDVESFQLRDFVSRLYALLGAPDPISRTGSKATADLRLAETVP
jgi:hypothetical protein